MSRFRFTQAAPFAALFVFLALWRGQPLRSVSYVLPPTPPPDYRLAIDENRRSGRPLQALYWLQAQADADGWTTAAHREAGDLWWQTGDAPRALYEWELVASEVPEDTQLIRALAAAYIDMGWWPQAVAALDRLAVLTPDDLWVQLQLGLIRAPMNPSAALSHLRRARAEAGYEETADRLLAVVENAPSDPDLSMRVGLVLMDMSLWPYAEQAFTYAGVLNDPYPLALAYTGLMRDRQYKDGSAWLNEAMRLSPDDPDVLLVQALHLRAQGDYAASRDVLAAAVQLAPDQPVLYAELGLAYQQLGELTEAEYWLQMAVRFSNQDARYLEMLALFYADSAAGLTPEGVEALFAAAAQNATPDARAGVAWALFQQGQRDRGLEMIDGLLAQQPEHSRAQYYKALMLLDNDDPEAARPLLLRLSEKPSEFRAEALRLLAGLS